MSSVNLTGPYSGLIQSIENAGIERLTDNLRLCYEQLIRMELVGRNELDLLEAWIDDCEAVIKA